jgi:phosphoribosylanthranilate isomerase
MTWIKICGITNLEDALTAVDAGADALGFVFYEKSPRNIDPGKACEIVQKLPARIEKIGVFVDDPVEQIREIARQVGLTAVQVYVGDREPKRGQELLLLNESETDPKLIVVFPAEQVEGEGLMLTGTAKKTFYALMLDSGSNTMPGGTGKTFQWNKAQPMIQFLSATVPIIVAGGLTPLNVAEAIGFFQPWGVDVSSGVEAKPGKKDPEKVRAFIAAVRNAEKVT